MVLQICVDDSSQDGESLILAGYIASVENWASFSTEWAGLLTVRPPWDRLKMSELMADGPGSEKGQRIEWHYRIIEKYAHSSICLAIPRRPLSRAVRDLQLPTAFGNPYYLAWRALISVSLHWQHKSGNHEPIDFIFDEQSEAGLLSDAWEGFRDNMPEEFRRLVKNRPIFRDDEDFLPLQAADMLAWWMRRRFAARKTIMGHDFPFPWGQQRDGLEMLLAEINERGIRKQLKRDKAAMLNDPSQVLRLSDHWTIS